MPFSYIIKIEIGEKMYKIEKFLNSNLYLILIFSFTLISWSSYEINPQYGFNFFNMISIYILFILMTCLLIFFKNTVYILPLLLSLLFIVNKADMTFDTTMLIFPIICVSLFLIGLILHLIRFKIHLDRKVFFWGFLLIAVGYVLPLIYLPFVIESLPVSLLGFFYFMLYVFLSNTLQSNQNYFFKILLGINLLLTAQVFVYIYHGFFIWTDLSFFDRLFLGWLRNLGWGNINDVTFYITLTFPSYIYFIFKKQKSFYLFLMILPIIAVFLTKSRGGYLGFFLILSASLIFIFIKGDKKFRKYIFGLISIPFCIILIAPQILTVLWSDLSTSFGNGFDFFTGNRIYIYTEGLKIFRQYPFFGGGWLSINSFAFDGRIFMFHSTIIQSLATMGLFGAIALGFHYYQIAKYMGHSMHFEKYLFLFAYIATQMHGLIENVQYSVPYSIFLVIILSSFETFKEDTQFYIHDNEYLSIQ